MENHKCQLNCLYIAVCVHLISIFPYLQSTDEASKQKLLTVPTCAPKNIAKKLSPFDFFKLKLRLVFVQAST